MFIINGNDSYNTDYILVKEENLDKAVAALTQNGYDFC